MFPFVNAVEQVCEVDVFKHPRFCDDLTSSACTFCCKCKALLMSHIDQIVLLDV